MKYKVQLAQLTGHIVGATPVMWKQQMFFYALLQSEWLSNCLHAVYSVKLYVKKEDTLKCLQLWRQNNRVIIFFYPSMSFGVTDESGSNSFQPRKPSSFLWWEWINPNFEFVHPFPWTSLCLHKISVSSLLTAVKNQVTGNFILNEKSEDAKSKTFIENGLQWEYSIEGERETLKTTGPLHEGIIVLVSVSSKFSELQFVLPNFCLF